MDMLELIRQILRNMTLDKHTLYVLSPASIGDFLICGGLCHALLRKKHKQTCVLIVTEKYANSGLNFVGVKEVRYIPRMLMELIQKYIMATREFETENFIYGHFHWGDNPAWNKKLPFINRYKENVFGLPLDTEFIPPLVDELQDYQKQRLHANYTLDKARTVILAPYANSLANLDGVFWNTLASELIGKGYVLYINVANSSEKVLPGTAPIVTTFPELLYIAEKVNCFIGLRSGIFDLLALTNAKLLYVINQIEHWHYDLNLNYNHANSRAFYFADFDRASMQAFMQQNNLSSIDDVIFNGCIRGRDIAFDTDSLLEKILSAVN